MGSAAKRKDQELSMGSWHRPCLQKEEQGFKERYKKLDLYFAKIRPSPQQYGWRQATLNARPWRKPTRSLCKELAI